jgi:hypothetical protein
MLCWNSSKIQTILSIMRLYPHYDLLYKKNPIRIYYVINYYLTSVLEFNNVIIPDLLKMICKYSETCLIQTSNKPESCINQT